MKHTDTKWEAAETKWNKYWMLITLVWNTGFFGKSIPDSMKWEYLTVEQAAADLHTINQLFRKIYKGKWISTGISKGGQTTLYFKYFYPEDVDIAIP